MKSVIVVRDLAASVRLGWHAEERTAVQPVSLDLRIEFLNTPRACKSDDLKDTLCYSELSNEVLKICEDREFKLIEHMAYEILDGLKKHTRYFDVQIGLRVTKLNAPVRNLRGGVSFSYGHLPEGAW